MNDVVGGGVLFQGKKRRKKGKKGGISRHNKSTNMITNSNALSFGLVGLIPFNVRDRFVASLGVGGIGDLSAMV